MQPTDHDGPDLGWEVLDGLARRVLGPLSSGVRWARLDDGSTGSSAGSSTGRRYEVHGVSGSVTIAASDVGAAAYGLHEYLKVAARRRICWDTPLPLRLDRLPDALPEAGVSGSLPDGPVYHLNFCTFSYTTAYWDWDRWEREIDWMALHGVTMPLAAVGHEAVLAEVYRALGVEHHEIRTFLGSPAYLAWQFMGCLDGWGGPMTDEWIDEHRSLGARIIDRQREYAMTPVLPAFVGHVPASLARHDTTTRDWWGFTTHLLDPADPRLSEITRLVVETQRAMFGVSHLYAADPFIETVPPDDDPHYLERLADALVSGLRAGDPDAVWVMQAWTFDYLDWWTDDRIAAFLDAIPNDAMLLLDLWGEKAPQWRRFGGFRGKPWIWCALHDFGGRCDLFGDLERIRRELDEARNAAEPPMGIGMAMEATEQNHVMYEWVLAARAEQELPAREWVHEYAGQRYAVADPRLAQAWEHLLATVYAAPEARVEPTERPGSVTLRPNVGNLLDPDHVRSLVEQWCWYDVARLLDACRLLADVTREHPDLAAAELGHDLVVAAATAMVRVCDRLLLDMVEARSRDDRDLAAVADRFLDALADVDALLGTRPELRLDTWESAAASWARDADQEPSLADGARRLLSTWTATDGAPLTDYAARLWHGLVGRLYRERWRVWTELLIASREGGHDPDSADLDNRIDAVTTTFLAGALQGLDRPNDLIDPTALISQVTHVLARYGDPTEGGRP